MRDTHPDDCATVCSSQYVDPALACLYWEEATQSWQSAGVVLLDVQSSGNITRIGCAAVHLTSFVIGSASIGEGMVRAECV